MTYVIGITGQDIETQIDAQTLMHAVRTSYIDVFASYGGLPVIIPNLVDQNEVKKYVSLIDGLCLTGGGDISPLVYGRKQEEETGKYHQTIDSLRDATELVLVRECLALGKPVLGICRGCQMINVACGGTLVQHIPDDVGENHFVGVEDGLWYVRAHDVVVKDDSLLFGVVKKERLAVNSVHHQMIDVLGNGLVVSGYSPAGVPEAIEGVGSGFVLGLQWHPEKMLDELSSVDIFKAFFSAIGASRGD